MSNLLTTSDDTDELVISIKTELINNEPINIGKLTLLINKCKDEDQAKILIKNLISKIFEGNNWLENIKGMSSFYSQIENLHISNKFYDAIVSELDGQLFSNILPTIKKSIHSDLNFFNDYEEYLSSYDFINPYINRIHTTTLPSIFLDKKVPIEIRSNLFEKFFFSTMFAYFNGAGDNIWLPIHFQFIVDNYVSLINSNILNFLKSYPLVFNSILENQLGDTALPKSDLYNSLISKNLLKSIEEVPELDYLTHWYKEALANTSSEILELSRKTIISDLPSKVIDKKYVPGEFPLGKVIYNQDKYDEGIILKTEGFIEGNALSFDEATPIGYNIHLPKNGDVKAICVFVYGGIQSSERADYLDEPGIFWGATKNLVAEMLGKNIAVVTLNLIDLLELEVFQNEMPDSIHQRLHQSVNKFWEVLNHNPESLHPDLTDLTGKKIFLYGASFGGGVSVNHGELFPGTYSGYISFEGILSFDMGKKSDGLILAGSTRYAHINEKLDIKATIENLIEPVLVIQNFDDNNVNVKVALDFYKDAHIKGKDVQLLVVEKGGDMTERAQHNKGHFLSYYESVFNKTATGITNFILDGPSVLSTVSDWRAFTTEIYADKNYRCANFSEKFISLAYRLYKKNDDQELVYSPDNIKSANEEIRDTTWNKYYKPLYDSLKHFQDLQTPFDVNLDITTLIENNLLSATAICKAIEYNWPAFREVLAELVPSVDHKKIESFYQVENQLILYKMFTTTLCDTSTAPSITAIKKYLLFTLYMSNPDMIQHNCFLEFSTKKQLAEESEIKNLFVHKLEEESSKIKAVWHQATKAILVKKLLDEHHQNKETASLDETTLKNLVKDESATMQDFFEDYRKIKYDYESVMLGQLANSDLMEVGSGLI